MPENGVSALEFVRNIALHSLLGYQRSHHGGTMLRIEVMGHKILVIDDNPDLRDMLTGLLSVKGYTVLTARDGEVGVATAAEEHPDLVICDIAMPNMDGFQVLEKLRDGSETSEIPLLFLTASMTRSEEERVLQANANGFLTKPYNSRDLFEMVEKLLGEVE